MAVNVALAPRQIETSAGLMDAAGRGLTVTCLVADAVQPLASVTVTENDVVEFGFTLILAVVTPVFHE